MARRAAAQGLHSGVRMGQQMARARSGPPILPTSATPSRTALRAAIRSRSGSPATAVELRGLLASGGSAPNSPTAAAAAGSPRAAQHLGPVSSAAALAAEQGGGDVGASPESGDDAAAYATGRRARFLAGMALRRRAGREEGDLSG